MSWIALIGALAVLLAIDLLVVRGRGGEMSLRAAERRQRASGWRSRSRSAPSCCSPASARTPRRYLAGYLVEKSLSLDNVFVFLLVFTAFGLPAAERHRLLSYGIVAALALRLVFIVVGAAALSAFGWLSFVFAAFLVWTGWKMLRHRHDHGAEEAMVERRAEAAAPRARPLGALDRRRRPAAIAVVDVIFAVDSVPAILAITSDTFIVFAANAFALLGLRPLFFLVADLVERLYYLKTALAVLLVFIGAKMAAAEFVGKIGPEYSLPAIAAILGTGVVASLVRNRRAILRECDFPESSPPSPPPSTQAEQSTSTPSQPTPARSSTPV